RIHVNSNNEDLTISFLANNVSQTINVVPNQQIDNEFFNLIFKINNEAQFYTSLGENELYFVINDYKALTRSLHSSLNVYTLSQDAKTIEVSFASNNPRLATDVVSSVINTFFLYDLEKKSESSASILDFIDTQLDTVFLQLKDSESKIQNFKDSSKINNPTLFTQNVMDRVNELQLQLMTVDFDF